MLLDPKNGLYVFEVVLGYEVPGRTEFTSPYLIQANDADEAEEKIFEYMDEHGVSEDFWIEELSDPYTIEEYQQMIQEDGDRAYILLEDLTEQDLRELVGPAEK